MRPRAAIAMPDFRVLLTDYAWADLDVERDILAEVNAELLLPEASDEAALLAAAPEADAIMTNWAQVPASVIEAAVGCRIIARLGVGLDNIDIECATARGIPVTNVPDYCVIEVAEHAIALLLSLARKVAWYHEATQRGVYELTDGAPLRRIEGQTLGLVGCGQIGGRVAQKALGLGLRVVATTRSERELPTGVARLELDALLAESDYVSLHCPLTAETKHLIGAEQLARMKRSAYLINTARGGVVDHATLAAALAEDQIAGAALDVQTPEPPELTVAPYSDPRVIVTPHAAFVSEESLQDLRVRSARQVVDGLCGRVPENVVNGVAPT